VQLALTPLVEAPDVWNGTFDRLLDAGVTVLSGMLETVGEDYSSIARIAATGGVRPDATWPATRERAASVAALAGRQGIRLVTLHAGFLPHERNDPERGKMLDRLRAIAQLFSDVGCDIAFETGQEPASTLVDCLRELEVASVGVNFDPANMLLYGSGDPIEALTRLAPWIRQAHVKDAVPSGTSEWGTEVAVGTGAVDWPAFVTAIASAPHRPNLIIEREAGEARIEEVRTAKALIERLIHR